MKSTAAPVGAQALDDAEQPLDLDRRERRGRLVHDDHLRVERQRLADLDDLLLGDREPAGDPGRIEPHAEALEDLRRRACASPRRSMRRPLASGWRPMKMFSATVRSGNRIGSW